MSVYSVAEIINRNLVAKQDTEIYRLPDDNAKPVFVVKAGKEIGVVVSYINKSIDKNRQFLYWTFKDQNGKFYYARHMEGQFDVGTLKDQGAKNVIQQTEAQQKKEDPFSYYFATYGKPILIGIAVTFLASTFIKSRK
jgi:hypothetical protein